MHHRLAVFAVVLCFLAGSAMALDDEDAPASFGFTETTDIDAGAACTPIPTPVAGCADTVFGGCVEELCGRKIDELYNGAPSEDKFREAEQVCLAQEDPCQNDLARLDQLVSHRTAKLATLTCQNIDAISEAFRWSPVFSDSQCKPRAAPGLATLAGQRCQVERKREECNAPVPDPVLRCALDREEIDTLRVRKRALCAYTLPPVDGVVPARLASCDIDAAGESEAQCLSPDLIEDRFGQGCRQLATVPLPYALIGDRIPTESAMDLTVAFSNQATGDDACLFGLGLDSHSCNISSRELRVSGRTLFERGESDSPSTVTAYFGMAEAAQNDLLRVRFILFDERGEPAIISLGGLFSDSENQCSVSIDPRTTSHAFSLRRSLVGHYPGAVFDSAPYTDGPVLSDCARVPGRNTICWSQSLWTDKPPHFSQLTSEGDVPGHERFRTWRPDAAEGGEELTSDALDRARGIAGASPFYRLATHNTTFAVWMPDAKPQNFHVLPPAAPSEAVLPTEAAWLDLWLGNPTRDAAARFDWWLARWPLMVSARPSQDEVERPVCWLQGTLGSQELLCGDYGFEARPRDPFAQTYDESVLFDGVGSLSAQLFFYMLAEVDPLQPVTWISSEPIFDHRAILRQSGEAAVGVWQDVKGRSAVVRFRGRPPAALAGLAPEAQRWIFGAGADNISILPSASNAFATTPGEERSPLIVARLGTCTLARQSPGEAGTGWVDLAGLMAASDAEEWFTSTTAKTTDERLDAALACLSGERSGATQCGSKNLRAVLGEAAVSKTEIELETQCGG